MNELQKLFADIEKDFAPQEKALETRKEQLSEEPLNTLNSSKSKALDDVFEDIRRDFPNFSQSSQQTQRKSEGVKPKGYDTPYSIKFQKEDPEYTESTVNNLWIDSVKGVKDFFGAIERGSEDLISSFAAYTGNEDWVKSHKTYRALEETGDPIQSEHIVANAMYGLGNMLPGLLGGAAATMVAGPGGGLAFWGLQSAGDTYNTMRQEGIDRKFAVPAALITGSITAPLERLQLDKIIPGLSNSAKAIVSKNISELMKNGIKYTLKKGGREALEFGGDVAVETGVEVMQDMTQTAFQNIAREVNDLINDTDTMVNAPTITEQLNQYWKTAQQSAGPLLIASVSGRGMTSIVNRSKQYREQNPRNDIAVSTIPEENAEPDIQSAEAPTIEATQDPREHFFRPMSSDGQSFMPFTVWLETNENGSKTWVSQEDGSDKVIAVHPDLLHFLGLPNPNTEEFRNSQARAQEPEPEPESEQRDPEFESNLEILSYKTGESLDSLRELITPEEAAQRVNLIREVETKKQDEISRLSDSDLDKSLDKIKLKIANNPVAKNTAVWMGDLKALEQEKERRARMSDEEREKFRKRAEEITTEQQRKLEESRPSSENDVMTEASGAEEIELAIPNSDRKRVRAVYKIVDADDLISSDHPNYKQQYQPRDRADNLNSAAQVESIANKLDFLQLADSNMTSTGAPLLDGDNQVLSGNARSMALKKAYELGKADDYRASLTEWAQKKGIEIPTDIKKPVLVRAVTDSDLPFEVMAELSNRPAESRRSDSEQAESDARELLKDNARLLNGFVPNETGNILAASNSDFNNAFIAAVNDSSLRNKDGSFAPALQKRVESAMLAALFESELQSPDRETKTMARHTITSLVEGDNGTRRQVSGIMANAGRILHLAKNKPSMDMRPHLAGALRELSRYREMVRRGQIKTVEDYLDTPVLFADESLTPEAMLLFEGIADPQSANQVQDYIGRIISSAENIDENTPDMFGAKPETIQEIIKRKHNEHQTDNSLFTERNSNRDEKKSQSTESDNNRAESTKRNIYYQNAAEDGTALRDNDVPASPKVFDLLGIPQGRIFADYTYLQSKHPNYFTSPKDAELAVRFVLENPDYSTHETGGNAGLVRKGNQNYKIKIRLTKMGNSYHIRSVHVLSGSQYEKQKNNRLNSSEERQPNLIPKGNQHWAGQPASNIISDMDSNVKSSIQSITPDIIKDLGKKYFPAYDLLVLDSQKDFIDLLKKEEYPEPEIRAAKNRIVNGVWMEVEGQRRIVIIAANAKNRDSVLKTIMHEVVGHDGLNGVFGNALNPVLSRLADYFGIEKDQANWKIRTEEAFAREVESFKPDGSDMPSALQQIWTELKLIMSKFFDGFYLNDADVKAIVKAAYQYATEKTPDSKTDKKIRFQFGEYITPFAPEQMKRPELVRLAQSLMGKIPEVREKMGNRLGFFRADPDNPKIALRADIFAGPIIAELEEVKKGDIKIAKEEIMNNVMIDNPDLVPNDVIIKTFWNASKQRYTVRAYKRDENYASRTLAHEIGHLIDWLPDQNLSRGNVLGHIAALRTYLKSMIQDSPDSKESLITEQDRKQVARAAASLFQPPEGHPITDEIINRRKAYRDSKIEELIRIRRLKTRSEIMDELKALTQWWKPFNTSQNRNYTNYRHSPEELYADAVSVLLNCPNELKTRAPGFYALFESYRTNRPEVNETLTQIYAEIRSGDTDRKVIDKIYKGFEEADKAYAKAAEQQLKTFAQGKTWLMESFVSTFYSLEKYVQQAKKNNKISVEMDPVMAVEAYRYASSEQEIYVSNIKTEVLELLGKNDLDWQMFDEYLLHNRIIKERSSIANPLGITSEFAKKRLDEMKQSLGDERFAVLESARKLFWTARDKYVVDLAVHSGIFSKALSEKMRLNEHYATFDVVEYIDNEHGAGTGSKIYQQVGTLKETAGPGTATIMKDLQLIKSIRFNQAKKASVDFLLKFFPGEIKKAEKRMRPGGAEWVDKENAETGTIFFMHQGAVHAFYVDRNLADSFKMEEDQTVKTAQSIARALGAPFRFIFTEMKIGYPIMNMLRDFQRTARNAPGYMAPLHVVKNYPKALSAAWKSTGGVLTPVVKEMLENGELISIQDRRDVNQLARQIDRIFSYYNSSSEFRFQKLPAWKKIPTYLMWTAIRASKSIERMGKIAGHIYLKQKYPKMSAKEVAHMVRTEFGSPDFLAHGKSTWITNNILLFSNAAIQGWRSDLNALATRRDVQIKTILLSLIPKALMFTASSGALYAIAKKLYGDDDDFTKWAQWLQRIMKGIPEYDKANYVVIPLGLTGNGQSVYFRIPMDETNKFFGGVAWKSLTAFTGSNTDYLKNLSDIFNYSADQLPNMNPLLQVTSAVLDYIKGVPVIDSHNNRQILTNNELQARTNPETWDVAAGELAKWSWNTLGLSYFWNFREPTGVDEDGIPGVIQDISQMPVLNDIISRFLKVSDRGITENIRSDVLEPIRERKAVEAVIKKGLIEKYSRGEPTELTDRERAVLAANRKEISRAAKELRTRRSSDARSRSMIDARSREERRAIRNAE